MAKNRVISAIGVAALLSLTFFSIATATFNGKGAGSSGLTVTGEMHPQLYYTRVDQPMESSAVNMASPANAKAPYNPAAIQGAYNFGAYANGGAGKAIAIVVAYGDSRLSTDLATFSKTFGLTPAKLSIFYPAGIPRTRNTGWAIETAMDAEWAHASAQQAAIYVVVSPDASFSNMLKCVNYAATLPNVVVISMSWGAPENLPGMSSVIAAYDAAFSAIMAKGIALVGASGDGGATDGTSSLTTDYPASSPHVIAVGGTSLTLSAPGVWGKETAWNGSGGGYSATEVSAFQAAARITTGKRGVPDVAFNADPNTGVYVYCSSTWYQVGGTSLGAPCWAAIVADGAPNTKSLPLLKYLYSSVLGTRLYNSEIHDIQSGDNGGYTAGYRWDAVTGIGSPIVSKLITGQ